MSVTECWLVLNSGLGDFAFNMALDEALLETMPSLNQPVLRFYGWKQPAASFGYFQRYAEVEALTPLRPLVRRPTGGGIVPHDRDWTYSVAIPVTHEWYSRTAVESYRRIHAWIQGALWRLGIDAELAPAATRAQPGQCFAGWERFDVLSRGRKIAGAAQRRRKDGLLIQGSVQPPRPTNSREEWEAAMLDQGREERGISWADMQTGKVLEGRAKELADRKYSTAEHNQKR